jgi:hypothetical protein
MLVSVCFYNLVTYAHAFSLLLAVTFQVCIQNRYKLNKKHRKWVAQATSSGDSAHDKVLLQQAKVR